MCNEPMGCCDERSCRMKSLIERIEGRIHDAPMETEHLLDDAKDALESFSAPYRGFLTSSTAKITIEQHKDWLATIPEPIEPVQ